MIFTRREVTAFVISMRTVGRVANLVHLVHRRDSGLVHRRHSRFARLIIDATRLRLNSFSLLVSAVLNWSVTHLFDSLGRPNRLRELNTRPDPCR